MKLENIHFVHSIDRVSQPQISISNFLINYFFSFCSLEVSCCLLDCSLVSNISRASILVALLAMSSMVISDDPSCFKTEGNDIVYDGDSDCPEVTIYTKDENLKMTFGVSSTPTTTRYITMRLGGCNVDGLRVSATNNIGMVHGSDPVDSFVADGNKIEFHHSDGGSRTQECDRDASFDYTVLMDGFPYWVLIITAVVGVVLSVIGSVVAFICFKNSGAKPTKPIESTKLKASGSRPSKNTSKGSSKKSEPVLLEHFQHHGLEPIGICRPDGKKRIKKPEAISYWFAMENVREQKSLEENPKAIMI